MGFVRIFWEENIQEAYLPKTSISGQIVSEILAQLYSDDSMQILSSKFDSVHNFRNRVKFRRICLESLELNWANISATVNFCRKMLVFGK